MIQAVCRIRSNEALTAEVYRMELEGDTSALIRPGQFVNVKLDGLFLRRPISVCDWGEHTMVLIYKTVGAGTTCMSRMKPDAPLDLLIGLGNGFSIHKSGDHPLLIGGGVGIPPLYGLCRRLRQEGKPVTAVLGFRTAADVFYIEEFRALGAEVRLVTENGSAGARGFVTDALGGVNYSYVYTCGPEAMLRAVDKAIHTGGEFSFEERMGCGFGACMGCTCKTKYETKRICRDGPVLEREEIVWETRA